MTAWTETELTRIAAATNIEISTRRPDGTLRTPVPIWVVRGRRRGVRPLLPRAGRRLVPPRTADQIDRAYRSKYAAYGGTYVQPMTAGPARQATLRLRPLQHHDNQTGENT